MSDPVPPLGAEALLPVGVDRARLAALIGERGLDGLLLSSPANVFYTTGYPALPGSGNPIVHALRGWPTPLGVVINTAVAGFTPDGECTDNQIRSQLVTMTHQVLSFARRPAAPEPTPRLVADHLR